MHAFTEVPGSYLLQKMHSEMDALRQEMNDVSSKIDFAEETIGVQSHELETLKMKLDQSVLEVVRP